MRIPSPVIFLLPLIALPSFGFFARKAPPGPHVLVMGDVFSEEQIAVRPDREHPVYYVILPGREAHVGGEGSPLATATPEFIQAQLTKVLAPQGYLLTEVGGPMPSLVLMYQWGRAELALGDLDDLDTEEAEELGLTMSSQNQLQVYDHWQRRRAAAFILGTHKTRNRLLFAADAQVVDDAGRVNRLYLYVTAFDAAALARREQKVVWRLSVSIPEETTSLVDSLPVMLASAAAYFGRDTSQPVFIRDADRRRTEVEIGPAEVVEPDVSLPSTDAPGAAP